jgi:Animal haem peroxidase
MIGMYAEPKPRGFGFSDTAFRVFILMASRRLESDRFFTKDYRPEVYTQVGFDWVESYTMRDVLLRHFPELEPALQGVANPFAPWTQVGAHG